MTDNILQRNIMRYIDNISYTKIRLLNRGFNKLGTIWEAMDFYKFTDEEKLEIMKRHYRYLAIQGSAGWKAERSIPKAGNRVPCVGGSELAQLTGDNPYSDKYDLLLTKLGKNINIDDINTRWGNLNEDVLFSIIKKILKTEDIFETGSITGLVVDGYPIQNYSPDGIGICNTITIKSAFKNLFPLPVPDDIKEIMEYKDRVIVLFEGKSPLSRKPDGKTVTQYYLPQPKIGLCTIPICDFAVFTEGIFRVCSEKDWGWNTVINEDFHKPEKNNTPKYLGAILFVSKVESDQDIIDFGAKDKGTISKLLERWSEDRFNESANAMKAIYPDPIIGDEDLDIWLGNIKNTPKLVGILFWKCFNLSFIPVSKDKNYANNCLPKIKEFHLTLKNMINNVKPEDFVNHINLIREREINNEGITSSDDEFKISWNFKSIVKKFSYNGNLMF